MLRILQIALCVIFCALILIIALLTSILSGKDYVDFIVDACNSTWDKIYNSN